MADVSFPALLGVALVALAAPFLAGLVPALRLPVVALDIVLGIVVGPGLGWLRVDTGIEVLSTLGLGLLLFLAGLELDLGMMRSAVLRVAGSAFAVSCALALAAGFALDAAGVVAGAPTLVAVALAATSLGLVVPVLKDAGATASELGRLVFTAGTLAEFVPIVFLSLEFSKGPTTPEVRLLLLGAFVVLAVAGGLALLGTWRSPRFLRAVRRDEDTTVQLGVRIAMVILVATVALADRFGLEGVLGAFVAGALLRLVDPEERVVHLRLRTKLEAVGFGFLVPVFFVSTGLRFDLDALLADASSVVRVPVLLVALLAVRGAPALLYRRAVGARRAAVAGLFQATSLSFIVVAAHVGGELGDLDRATGAALVAAGLLSVVLFPPAALALLRRERAAAGLPTLVAPLGRPSVP